MFGETLTYGRCKTVEVKLCTLGAIVLITAIDGWSGLDQRSLGDKSPKDWIYRRSIDVPPAVCAAMLQPGAGAGLL